MPKENTTQPGVDSVTPEQLAAMRAEVGELDTSPQHLREQQADANSANAAQGFVEDDDTNDVDLIETTQMATDGSTRPLKPHEKQLNDLERIAQRKRALIRKDFETPDSVDEDDDDTVNSTVGQDVSETTQPNGQAPAQAAQAPNDDVRGFYIDDQGNRMVAMIVNGQRVTLPEATVLATLQKETAGDQKLREAAARTEELNRREQALLAQQQQQSTAQPSTQDVASVAVKELESQRRQALMDLYNGDESAVDRLTGIDSQLMDAKVKAYATPAVDVRAQLAQISHEQRVADWGKQVSTSEAELLADPEYADLAKSNVTWGAVAAEAGRLVKDMDAFNKGIHPKEVMKLAAQNIRSAFAAPAPQPDVRAQRKQQVGNTALSQGSQGTVQQRQHVPTPTPDGGPSPAQQRQAALKELKALKKEH